MTNLAPPTSSSAAASIHGAATLALELLEARQLRNALKLLLRREQAAMAEFLVELADFDRRRGWEPLGHASFFAFLHFELGLSNSAAFYRMSAARLLQRFPDLVGPIRDGRLCLSTTAELAKVVTRENRWEVVPRFFGRSAREAQEVVAELQPRPAPPRREVVMSMAQSLLTPEPPQATRIARPPTSPGQPTWSPSPGLDTDSGLLLTSEEGTTHPARVAVPRDDVEPLTADLRRLHITVSRQFLKKVETARDGLSHAIPGATMEQVLENALDLLLEKQAKARGQVKRPRATGPAPAPVPSASATVTATATATKEAAAHPSSEGPRPADAGPGQPVLLTEPPPPRRTGPREHVSAAVRRAVWERDGGRCAWPLDGGGVCGSTHQVEVDHFAVPWARGGQATLANLRLLCHAHNTLAARQVFGARCVERYARARRRPGRELRPVE